MSDREEVGRLHKAGYGTWRAECAKPTCGWSWAGDRGAAERHLRGHADISHPAPVVIYREVPS